MKISIWVLNFIQFMIVYISVFWLHHQGFIDWPVPRSFILAGLWPVISIGIAGIPWKYYNKFSLLITSKRTKTPKSTLDKKRIRKKQVNKTKPVSALIKILITILSLVYIFLLAWVSLKYQTEFIQKDPKSEYFDFRFSPNMEEDYTVEYDGVRYLKEDMSLFSGELNGGTFGEEGFYQLNYLNGKLNGDVYLWKYKCCWLKVASYKDGKLDDVYKEWYSNGQLKKRAFYTHGLKQGDWKEWGENGRLIKHWVMKNDILIHKIVN